VRAVQSVDRSMGSIEVAAVVAAVVEAMRVGRKR
jgi:hypothetical protein